MITPPLAIRAWAVAAALGLTSACRDEDGMLLHVLAGRRGIERVAEIGTGTGVGTADEHDHGMSIGGGGRAWWTPHGQGAWRPGPAARTARSASDSNSPAVSPGSGL